jgi:cytoskeletal protein RodZ
MATFGEKLRREREARGIGLEEIAAATKISPRYLDALERDDFEQLPGDVFTRGFVRAYAEQVGLAPDDLIEAFERERDSRVGAAPREDGQAVLREMSRLLADREDERATDRRGRTVAWIVGGLVVVAAAVVWLSVRVGPSPEDSRVDEPVQAAAPVSAPAPEQSPILEEGPPTVEAIEPERSALDDDARATAAILPEEIPEAVAPPPERAPEQAATPAPETERVALPEPTDAGRLTVPDHAVGTGIANREIVGAGDRFTEGEQIWFWTRVVGGRTGETIRHVWIHEGHETATVELRLGGSHWRTQSRKTLRSGSTGRWAVEARDAAGYVLARREFVCEVP